MRRSLALLALAFALGACASMQATPTEPAVTAQSPHIVGAVADNTNRPTADRERDAARHPADILAFAQVRPGQRVADVGPGSGYYTRLFSTAVGESGRVYGIIRPPQPNATQRAAIYALAEEPAYSNIVASPQDLANWSLPEPLDVIFISQIYHDFHLPRFNLDVAAANRTMFNALKPGGVLIIVDHAAIAGTDLTVPDTLHRIDEAIVRREVEAAGFVFDGSTEILRDPSDARTLSVFDENIRGRTDQFVLRFRKPG